MDIFKFILLSVATTVFADNNVDTINIDETIITFSGLQFLEQQLQSQPEDDKAFLAIYLNHTEFESNQLFQNKNNHLSPEQLEWIRMHQKEEDGILKSRAFALFLIGVASLYVFVMIC